MTNTSDDGRVSMVVERATEGRFLAMLRQLAPAQTSSADLRSVETGRDGSGGLRETTATERAIDRGDGARARTAHARISRVPWGDDRATLVWLVTYAHAGDLGTLAALYATHAAPMAMREAAQTAPWEAKRTATAYDAARRVAVASGSPEAAALARDAKTRADSARARERTADAALRSWGAAAMGAALEAWERTDADAMVAA
jgi:hypothetical protein